jgi:hypothetical protein
MQGASQINGVAGGEGTAESLSPGKCSNSDPMVAIHRVVLSKETGEDRHGGFMVALRLPPSRQPQVLP